MPLRWFALAPVQVGPRACLQPIKMFAGSFGGPVIYENAAYVSPNTVRLRQMHSNTFIARAQGMLFLGGPPTPSLNNATKRLQSTACHQPPPLPLLLLCRSAPCSSGSSRASTLPRWPAGRSASSTWPLTRCHTTSWQTCSSDDVMRHGTHSAAVAWFVRLPMPLNASCSAAAPSCDAAAVPSSSHYCRQSGPPCNIRANIKLHCWAGQAAAAAVSAMRFEK